MERESTKHTPRIDEQLAHDTESLTSGAPVEARVEESREQEPAADGEPVPDALLRGGRDPRPNPGLDHDDVQERSELARFLEPSAFPGDPAALRKAAGAEQAPDWVRALLDRLPDRTFDNVQQVWEAAGGEAEQRF
jgi:hypothetical protein